jgi:hypothetical protein
MGHAIDDGVWTPRADLHSSSVSVPAATLDGRVVLPRIHSPYDYWVGIQSMQF